MFPKNSHHSTSSSAWFCRTLPLPTKTWSLFPLPLNLGGTLWLLQPREYEKVAGWVVEGMTSTRFTCVCSLLSLSSCFWKLAIMLRSHEEVTYGCSGWQLHATRHVSRQTSDDSASRSFDRDHRLGFLNLSTEDILDQMILCGICEVPCAPGYLTASLASTL